MRDTPVPFGTLDFGRICYVSGIGMYRGLNLDRIRACRSQIDEVMFWLRRHASATWDLRQIHGASQFGSDGAERKPWSGRGILICSTLEAVLTVRTVLVILTMILIPFSRETKAKTCLRTDSSANGDKIPKLPRAALNYH